jgi:hypothetical protein
MAQKTCFSHLAAAAGHAAVTEAVADDALQCVTTTTGKTKQPHLFEYPGACPEPVLANRRLFHFLSGRSGDESKRLEEEV